MNKELSIAIDGPSGVGKSTIAKAIAKELDLFFINTGLMYRAIAYHAIKNELNLQNENEIANELTKIKLEILPNELAILNEENITNELWKDNVSLAASIIAKYESIRNYCVDLQRKIASQHQRVIMEGRDIGSVVLPNATLKIFLTASVEIRAKRRVEQLLSKGQKVDEKFILKNVIERDKRDSQRTISPLVKTNDAIEIDTSNLTIEEVINKIIGYSKEIEER